MSGSGKGLLGLWLYRTGEEWAMKEGSPVHKPKVHHTHKVLFILYVWITTFVFISQLRFYHPKEKQT